MLKGKIITLNTCIREEERAQFNNLNFYVKKLEKGGQTNPKATRRKEMIMFRVELMK